MDNQFLTYSSIYIDFMIFQAPYKYSTCVHMYMHVCAFPVTDN